MMQERRGKREASGSPSSTVLAKLSVPSQLAEYITSITSARGAQRGGRPKKKDCATDCSEEQSGRGEGRTENQKPVPRKKPNAGVWKQNGDGSVRLVERKVGSFSATRENRMTDLAVREVLMSSRSGRKYKGTIPLIHVPLLELHELTLPESPEPLGKICFHIPRLMTRAQETTDGTLTMRVLNHTLWLLLG
jgi:hypothetical protein